MTDAADALRQLDKLQDALEWAIEHHVKKNESNAAEHTNGKVFYSPLAVKLQLAHDGLKIIRDFVDYHNLVDAEIVDDEEAARPSYGVPEFDAEMAESEPARLVPPPARPSYGQSDPKRGREFPVSETGVIFPNVQESPGQSDPNQASP